MKATTTGAPVLSVCEGVLRLGNLAEDLDAAVEAGYRTVQLEQHRVDAVGVDVAGRLLADAGVTVSSLGSSPADPLFDDGTAALNSIEVAAALGIEVVAIHPGALRGLEHAEAADRTRRWLSNYGPRAAEAGAVLVLEPIHPLLRHYTWIHTLRHAAALAEDIEGAGVMVDVAHLWWDPDLVGDFARSVHLVRLVQLANVDPAALREERYARAPLGEGDIPVAGLVRAFRAAGYRGSYELEVRLRMPRSERVAFVRSERQWFESMVAGEDGDRADPTTGWSG
jgi:sugar phosphate isomerase/epimerase